MATTKPRKGRRIRGDHQNVAHAKLERSDYDKLRRLAAARSVSVSHVVRELVSTGLRESR